MRDSGHHLFYGGNIAGNTIILDENEANHAVSVLRLKIGRSIQITDGYGIVYTCQCADIQKQSISCQITEKAVTPKLIPELTLLTGLPDKEHFETILEHATALGVSRVIPLIMDHCRKPWWESWDKLRGRFTAKMVVSMKQCLYPYIPQLDAPASLSRIIGKCEEPLIVADQRGKFFDDADVSSHQKIACLIGPPGGMSAGETGLLESHGSLTVRIAPTRLRTELAAAVLCSRVRGVKFQSNLACFEPGSSN